MLTQVWSRVALSIKSWNVIVTKSSTNLSLYSGIFDIYLYVLQIPKLYLNKKNGKKQTMIQKSKRKIVLAIQN